MVTPRKDSIRFGEEGFPCATMGGGKLAGQQKAGIGKNCRKKIEETREKGV